MSRGAWRVAPRSPSRARCRLMASVSHAGPHRAVYRKRAARRGRPGGSDHKARCAEEWPHMHDTCLPHAGRVLDYQIEASDRLRSTGTRTLLPWSWITATCGTDLCLNEDHLTWESPVKISYPPGVCVYCGMPAGTLDHLIPRTWSGESLRRYVAVVPSCGQCNSLLGDRGGFRISERREAVHEALRKKYREQLKIPDRSPEELAEYSGVLRKTVEENQRWRQGLRLRLAWPDDPTYDMRAFQKTGIESPEQLDIL